MSNLEQRINIKLMSDIWVQSNSTNKGNCATKRYRPSSPDLDIRRTSVFLIPTLNSLNLSNNTNLIPKSRTCHTTHNTQPNQTKINTNINTPVFRLTRCHSNTTSPPPIHTHTTQSQAQYPPSTPPVPPNPTSTLARVHVSLHQMQRAICGVASVKSASRRRKRT